MRTESSQGLYLSKIVDLFNGVKMIFHALDCNVFACFDALRLQNLRECTFSLFRYQPILYLNKSFVSNQLNKARAINHGPSIEIELLYLFCLSQNTTYYAFLWGLSISCICKSYFNIYMIYYLTPFWMDQ